MKKVTKTAAKSIKSAPKSATKTAAKSVKSTPKSATKTAKKMMSVSKTSKKQKGFTLIELLIVVGIIAVIAAVAIPNLTRFLGTGKGEAWDSDQQSLVTLVASYKAEYGCYPTLNGTGGTHNANTRVVFEGYLGTAGAATTTTVAGTAAAATDRSVTVADGSSFFAGMQVTVNSGTEVWITSVDNGAGNDTIYLDAAIGVAAAVGTTVTTVQQGLVDLGMLDAPPESASADNKQTGIGDTDDYTGSYTWYVTSTGSIASDPDKDTDVYP
jgi:prepilin-type N-terminal cleavage/methylation domain-containing protein